MKSINLLVKMLLNSKVFFLTKYKILLSPVKNSNILVKFFFIITIQIKNAT